MSKRLNTRGISFYPILGILFLLACNAIAPPAASPAASPPTREIPSETPTTRPAVVIPFTQTPIKIRTPRPTHTNIPTQQPTSSEPEIKNSVDACSLVRTSEVSNLFPNPPAPSSETRVDDGYPVSNCIYNGNDVELSISIATSPGYVRALQESLPTIQSFPSYKKFNYQGMEIHQVGVVEENPRRNTFVGVIFKDNTAVQVYAGGGSYLYHSSRETGFLKAIAGRIPEVATLFNACDLVTSKEVMLRFPNPPAPVNEIHWQDGYALAICTFQEGDMRLVVGITAQPGIAEEMIARLQSMMKETESILYYTSYGAEIYQFGGPNQFSETGDVFSAYMVKGMNVVQVEGEGPFYIYNEMREIAWMKMIASRLP